MLCKYSTALTGGLWFVFVSLHLAGNLLIWGGPELLNAYARALHSWPLFLYFCRVGLLLSLSVHVLAALFLWHKARAARPLGYGGGRQGPWKLGSLRLWTGLWVLFFLLYHLAHLNMEWTHPDFQALSPHDLHGKLQLSFQSPWLTFFYTASILFLFLHLGHGLQSFFQTMGWLHPRSHPFFHFVLFFSLILLGLGFLSVPLGIFLGFL